MVSKKAILILLGLLAMVLVFSSEVAARDLAEASKEEVAEETTNGVEDAKYGGGGHNGGYAGNGGQGGGGHGGSGYSGGSGHGSGYCHYGCCGHQVYHGSCSKCCSYAGEAVAAETEDNTHN